MSTQLPWRDLCGRFRSIDSIWYFHHRHVIDWGEWQYRSCSQLTTNRNLPFFSEIFFSSVLKNIHNFSKKPIKKRIYSFTVTWAHEAYIWNRKRLFLLQQIDKSFLIFLLRESIGSLSSWTMNTNIDHSCHMSHRRPRSWRHFLLVLLFSLLKKVYLVVYCFSACFFLIKWTSVIGRQYKMLRFFSFDCIRSRSKITNNVSQTVSRSQRNLHQSSL